MEKIPLKQAFKDYAINIPEDQVNNKKWKKVIDPQKLRDLVHQQCHFFGYDYSIYEYVKFDTYSELQLARQFEKAVQSYAEIDQPFWVRNQRNIFFTYGNHKYYPDFIVYHKGIIYVVEAKGEIYEESRKNLLLKKLNEVKDEDGKLEYRGMNSYHDMIDRFTAKQLSMDELWKESLSDSQRHQTPDTFETDPPEEEKFVSFLPVYDPERAYRKFVKKEKKVKVVGWRPVYPKSTKYPRTCYWIQVKGETFLPDHKPDDWVILDGNVDRAKAEGQIVLVYHPSISDGYGDGFTIRRLQIVQEQRPGELFPMNVVCLEGLGEVVEPIILRDAKAELVSIVGIITS